MQDLKDLINLEEKFNELRSNINELQEKEGLVGVKIDMPDRKNATASEIDVLLVLNNALKLRKQGALKPFLLSDE